MTLQRVYETSTPNGNVTMIFAREVGDLMIAWVVERSGNPSSSHGLTDQSGQTWHKFYGDEQDPGGSGQLSVSWWFRTPRPGEATSTILMPTAPGTVGCGVFIYRDNTKQNRRLLDVVSAGDILGDSPIAVGPTAVVDSELFLAIASHRNQSSACPTNPAFTNLSNLWEQAACSSNRMWYAGAEDTTFQTASKDTSYSWDGSGHEALVMLGAFRSTTSPRSDQITPLGGEILGWIPTVTAQDSPAACPDVFNDLDGTILGGVTSTRQREDKGAKYHWDFDGTGSITLAEELNMVGNYTASMWFRKGLDNQQLWAASSDPAKGVYLINDTTIRVSYGTSYDFTVPALGTGWHHLAVQWVDAQLNVFIDGTGAGAQSSVDSQFMFGNLGVSDFSGDIDDFRIFNRGLSDSEVMELSSRHAYQRRQTDG